MVANSNLVAPDQPLYTCQSEKCTYLLPTGRPAVGYSFTFADPGQHNAPAKGLLTV